MCASPRTARRPFLAVLALFGCGLATYLAPLISTALLIVVGGASWSASTLAAMALILAGAWLGR